jgi:uncharacterized protein (TIGR02147 family)
MPGASVHNYECYRTYLRSVLVGRIKSNPNYSLRAFAKSLGCSPALLSRSLNGKKNLSNRISAQFAAKLGLVERERDYFCTLVRLNQAKSSLEIEYLREHLGSFNGQSESRHFDNEMFSIISDWHHIALLEMTDLDTKVDLIWAAKKLGITVAEAKDALDRLVRVGLLKSSGKGWKKTHSDSHCESPGLNRGLRTFHAQMLDRIQASLETQSNSEKFPLHQDIRH